MYFDQDRADDKLGKVRDPIAKAAKYVRTRSPKEKLVMLCLGGLVVGPPTCPPEIPTFEAPKAHAVGLWMKPLQLPAVKEEGGL